MQVQLLHAGEEVIFFLLPLALVFFAVDYFRKRRQRKTSEEKKGRQP
jgi:hypothetical protein